MGSDAKDAFIIFDEAYEGNDVDAFYLGDILRALGCTISNASVLGYGGTTELAEKLESKQADQLMELLEVKEDEDGLIKYMELIDKIFNNEHHRLNVMIDS